MGGGVNLGFMARSGPPGSRRSLPARIKKGFERHMVAAQGHCSGHFQDDRGRSLVFSVCEGEKKKKRSHTAPETHTEHSQFKKGSDLASYSFLELI